MNLLCSVRCCVVTHCKQPLCALLICDCTFSYQSYIISIDFSTNRLRPCLFAHIDWSLELWELSEMFFFVFFEVLVVFLRWGCRCQIVREHLIPLGISWENRWEVRDLMALSAQSSTVTHLPPLCFHLDAFQPSWLCFASNIHILKHYLSQVVVVNMSFLDF